MDIQLYQNFANQHLGGEFNDAQLLVTAFTHRSYLNEHRRTAMEHNERLEFLGDAVLELVVTEHLYGKYSEPEGILTNWRSALVRTESIGAAAERLGVEKLLRLSRGEKKASSERARLQILANCFEAIIGAIYLDRGYGAAQKFIHESLLGTFQDILHSGSWVDPKSKLQETAQEHDSQTPSYRVLEESGPDHDKIFVVGVYIGDKLIGKGTGASKQAAQVAAAEIALKAYASNQAT